MANFGANFAGAGALSATSLVTTGTVSAAGGVTGQQKFFPDADVTETGGPQPLTSGRAYARYVGQSPRDITAADLYAYLNAGVAVAGGGGASLNWAELAVASAPLFTPLQASLNLTILAAVSFAAEAVAASISILITKPVSGFVLGKDLGIWVIVACAFEATQTSMRFVYGSDTMGYQRFRAACRPSTNLNTPLAFTTTAPTAALVMATSMQIA